MKTFLSQELAKRIELADAAGNTAYIQAQHDIQPNEAADYHQISGGTLLFAGARSPVNRAIGLGFEPISEAQLIEIEEWFFSRQCKARLELCPFISKELLERLAARKYHLLSFKNVWALPLEELKTSETSIDVREIRPEERELWAQTTGRGFASREEDFQADASVALPMSFSQMNRCFLAFIDGEAVGGGAMSIHNGLASLFGMSTRVAFRRRGVQAALLYHRLKVAKEKGAELGIVRTTPTNTNSQRNVERLGFSLLYTNVTLGI